MNDKQQAEVNMELLMFLKALKETTQELRMLSRTIRQKREVLEEK